MPGESHGQRSLGAYSFWGHRESDTTEWVTQTHAHIRYKIGSQWKFAEWLSELRPVFHDNLEGWDGMGGGREVPEGGDICLPMNDSCWCMAEINQHCKATIFQCKKFKKKKESCCQCRRCRRHGFNLWVGKIPWRRKWQPTAVFLPGESHGQSSLVGYSPWGHKALDKTERSHTYLGC